MRQLRGKNAGILLTTDHISKPQPGGRDIMLFERILDRGENVFRWGICSRVRPARCGDASRFARIALRVGLI